MLSSTQSLVDPPANNPDENAATNGMVPSEFIIKLRAKFFGSEASTRLWNTTFADPDDEDGRVKLIAADIAAALQALILRKAELEVPEPTTINSAAEFMQELLEDTNWPDGAGVPVPSDFSADTATFRNYEVGCAAAVMVQAFHRNGGPGGEPTDYPPTHPH